MPKKEQIRFEAVSAAYGKKIILKDISFAINTNDFIGIVGPNGSGKTTLLKLILGIIKPKSGKIIRSETRFGYVPQKDIVHPVLPYTVYDIVIMGRYPLKKRFSRMNDLDKKIVNECLEKVGITHLKEKDFNDLSGGEKQRTLIARALAVKPAILILDEPTNGMDTPSHYALLDLISFLHSEEGLTILLVSHLLTDVANSVKEIILLEKNTFQFGLVDEILTEQNLKQIYSAEFKISKHNNEFLITTEHKE